MSLASRITSLATRIATEVKAKATIASPAFTGVPTAPTATPATDTTQIATTAFVLANGGSGGASVAIDDNVPTGDETLWFQPTTGRFMIKVDSQWVIANRDGIDGVDGADGADGTMPDGSVTYAKLANTLKVRAINNTATWDFAAQGIIEANISINTTIVINNLQVNETLKIDIIITNSATLAFPAYCKKLPGFVDPSGTNGTYYAWFECRDDGSGTELVLMSIAQEEV